MLEQMLGQSPAPPAVVSAPTTWELKVAVVNNNTKHPIKTLPKTHPI